MKHQGTLRLETPRLILRQFKQEDACFAFQNWTNDPLVTKFLTWNIHENEIVTEQLIADWIKAYQHPNFYQWTIELKSINQPIGTISVVAIDERIDQVEIGYCIGSQWWHQGIMSEAFQEVIRFMFHQVQVNRLTAKHDVENPHSSDVMKKCGLTFEGILRQGDRNNRGIIDVACYSIVRNEYFRE